LSAVPSPAPGPARSVSYAIQADQAVFAAGANALDLLTGVVIAASLLMAAGCAWAVSRRLAEYR
jgi:hypothetical protein